MRKRVIITVILSLCIFGNLYAQRVYVYTDSNGSKYAAVDASALNSSEDRFSNTNFWEEVDLYTLNGDGITYDPTGKKVPRVRRHDATRDVNGVECLNKKMSANFIIAPYNISYNTAEHITIYNDYSNPYAKTTWANASGYLESANTTSPSIAASAIDRGCPIYKGADGKDTSGRWRLPTQREAGLILIMLSAIDNTSAETGFTKIEGPTGMSATSVGHWIASENQDTGTYGWHFKPYSKDGMANVGTGGYSNKATVPRFIRCIKDIQK